MTIRSAAEAFLGAFPALQREYAAHGVATYPLRENKVPAITGYARVGVRGSARLVGKFADALGAGFCAGRRNGLTVVDIDSTDDRLVNDCLARFGATPLQVITPSGGRHLYYRHGGEARSIRPLPDIDILGSGNVVAAGSIVSKGRYSFERGSLADLDRLPPLRATPARVQSVPDGKRGDTLFKWLLRESHRCDDFDTLLDTARGLNMDCCTPPLTDEDVVKTARSAWGYETSGRNWVGRKARASTDREEILAFARDPGAAHLLSLLRVSHPEPDATFAIDQEKTGEVLLGWTRRTIRERIATLIEMKRLRMIYRGGRRKGDPHIYTLVRSGS